MLSLSFHMLRFTRPELSKQLWQPRTRSRQLTRYLSLTAVELHVSQSNNFTMPKCEYPNFLCLQYLLT